MNYTSPAVENSTPITRPFVLGTQYSTPTWTEQSEGKETDPA
jgi:hypothetical protein